MADRMERVGPYKLVKKLGEGSSGKVKLGVHTETGQEVAIKILDKNKLISDAKLLRRVEREIAVMRLIRHPNVLRLYDVFQSEAHLFLILEYVDGGELYGYVQKRGQLTVDEAFHFFSQLLSGLRYCHNNLICHRDLKLENLLLDKNRNLKIADFGMASLMPEGQLLATSCGSPHYASPEVVKGDKYNGFASDVWSCGVILYALTTGRLPFDADALPRLLLKVKRGKFAMPSNMDPDLQDLIKCMLAYDPANRIPPRLISKHPWYEKTLESVKETPEGLQPWHQELPEKDTVTYQMQLYRLAQDHLGSEESVNAEEIAAEDSLVGGEDFSLGRVFETEDEEETFRKFAAPIEDQDQEALITIASLLGGSSTVAEIQEQLREDVPNVEKVIYKLLLDRRDQDGKIDIDTEPPLKKVEEPGSRRGPSPPAGSSGLHPQEFTRQEPQPVVFSSPSGGSRSRAQSHPPEPIPAMTDALKSTVERLSLDEAPTRSDSGFAFGSEPVPLHKLKLKKKERQKAFSSAFGLFSKLPLHDILEELRDLFTQFGMTSWGKDRERGSWRASSDTMEVDVSLIPLDNSTCVTFTKIKGECDGLFAFLREHASFSEGNQDECPGAVSEGEVSSSPSA